jgi:hypothetical protein
LTLETQLLWKRARIRETFYRCYILTDLEEAGNDPAWRSAICTHRSHLPLSRCNLDPTGTILHKAVCLDVLGNCIEALHGEYPTPETKCHVTEQFLVILLSQGHKILKKQKANKNPPNQHKNTSSFYFLL